MFKLKLELGTVHQHSTTREKSLDKLRVLLTREQIAAKVAEMGARITADFTGESLMLIGVLKGATIFLADLARQIKLDTTFDFIAVSSHGNAKQQSGEVRMLKDVDRSVEGRQHHSGGGHSRHRPDTDVNVALAVAHLRGTPVKIGTVVGFPLGANLTVTKLAEAEVVLRNGALELDAVLNIAALKARDRAFVQREMRGLAQLAHSRRGALLKIILENALLNQEEKILACALAMEAGADFVKTSTGFAPSGATTADVVLMRGVVHEVRREGRWRHSDCCPVHGHG